MIGGLGMTALGALTGNPLLAMGGAGQMFGGLTGGAGDAGGDPNIPSGGYGQNGQPWGVSGGSGNTGGGGLFSGYPGGQGGGMQYTQPQSGGLDQPMAGGPKLTGSASLNSGISDDGGMAGGPNMGKGFSGYSPVYNPNEGMQYSAKRGGRIAPKRYDAGGLVFDPELSSELYQPDKESDEFRREAFNPYAQRLEGEREEPQPDPESIPQRDYIDRVDSGEAPDFREALMRHGQEKLAAPGNENYLNRNLPAQAYSSGAGGDDVPMPRSNPFAMNTSGGDGRGEINRVAPLAARQGLPRSAMMLDGDAPTAAPPAANPYARRPRSDDEEDVRERLRVELARESLPPPEIPDLPSMKRRKAEPRPWGGFDGRLMEMGLRLMASTGDRDSNGVPIGFGAGLGKAGVGTLESERKHREEQRKLIDDEMDDVKTLDGFQKWRLNAKEAIRNHTETVAERRARLLGILQKDSENRDLRRATAEARTEQARLERERKSEEAKEKAKIAWAKVDQGWGAMGNKWAVDQAKLKQGAWDSGTNIREQLEDGSISEGTVYRNKKTNEEVFQPGRRIMSKDRQETEYQVRKSQLEAEFPNMPLEDVLKLAKDPLYKEKATIRREAMAMSNARSDYIIQSKPYTDIGRKPPPGMLDQLIRDRFKASGLSLPSAVAGADSPAQAPGSAAPSASSVTPSPSGPEAQKKRAREWLENRKKNGEAKPGPEFFAGQRLKEEDFADILADWK